MFKDGQRSRLGWHALTASIGLPLHALTATIRVQGAAKESRCKVNTWIVLLDMSHPSTPTSRTRDALLQHMLAGVAVSSPHN